MRLRRRLTFFVIHFQRQIVVWLMLLSYCAAIFGVPIPSSQFKDTTTPFPCQNHACGCLNADQCWKSCCCFTPQERVVWAKEHHVPAPYHLVAEVAAQSEQKSSSPDEREQESCCRDKPCCSTSAKSAVTSKKPSYRYKSSAPNSQNGQSNTKAAKKSSAWILGMMARKCQGEVSEWSNTPLALPFVALVIWAFDWQFVGWLSSIHPFLHNFRNPPVVPPPRR